MFAAVLIDKFPSYTPRIRWGCRWGKFRVRRPEGSIPRLLPIPYSGSFCRVDRIDKTPAPLEFDTCHAGRARIFLRRPTAVRIRTHPGIPPATPPRPFSWSFRGRIANKRSCPRSAGRIHGRSCDRDRPRRRSICRQDNAPCNPPRYALQDLRSRWDDRQSPGRNCTLIVRTRSDKYPRDRIRIAWSPRHRKCPPRMALQENS